MGSVGRRLDDLEGHFRPASPEDEGEDLHKAIMVAILDEISSLRACRARHRYRGGTPPTPVQPTDPVGDSLGYPYTHGERTEFAIKRAVARLGFSEEESEEIIAHWIGWFRELDRERGGDRWDEVDAEGPPEPTPPRH